MPISKREKFKLGHYPNGSMSLTLVFSSVAVVYRAIIPIEPARPALSLAPAWVRGGGVQLCGPLSPNLPTLAGLAMRTGKVIHPPPQTLKSEAGARALAG
jgi:hypothetical protein